MIPIFLTLRPGEPPIASGSAAIDSVSAFEPATEIEPDFAFAGDHLTDQALRDCREAGLFDKLESTGL